jgi:hypothetical protein
MTEGEAPAVLGGDSPHHHQAVPAPPPAAETGDHLGRAAAPGARPRGAARVHDRDPQAAVLAPPLDEDRGAAVLDRVDDQVVVSAFVFGTSMPVVTTPGYASMRPIGVSLIQTGRSRGSMT